MSAPEDVQAAVVDRIAKNAEWAIETLGAEGMDGLSAVNFAHDILALASRLAAETARADAAEKDRDSWMRVAKSSMPLARYDAAKERGE